MIDRHEAVDLHHHWAVSFASTERLQTSLKARKSPPWLQLGQRTTQVVRNKRKTFGNVARCASFIGYAVKTETEGPIEGGHEVYKIYGVSQLNRDVQLQQSLQNKVL